MEFNHYRAKGNIETEELLNLKTVDLTDIYEILSCSRDLKHKYRQGERMKKLAGKNIFFIAKNAYGKAKLAFEIAVNSLDANPISVPLEGAQIDQIVNDKDIVKVLERFGFSLAVIDTSDRTDSLTLAKTLNIPVINANERAGAIHSLAVLLTAWERKNKLSGLKCVIVGDFEQDQTSLLYGMVKCKMDVTVVAPGRYANIQRALERAREYGDCKWTDDFDEAIKGADVIYSYSHEFGDDYKLTADKVKEHCPDVIFMQNIPIVKRGREAEEEVLDSVNSAIYELGENILHVERAAIYLLGK